MANQYQRFMRVVNKSNGVHVDYDLSCHTVTIYPTEHIDVQVSSKDKPARCGRTFIVDGEQFYCSLKINHEGGCGRIEMIPSNGESLATRLRAHADLHQDLAPHSEEQAQWANDLREAADLLDRRAPETNGDADDAARWRFAKEQMNYSFDGENRTHYMRAEGREDFQETIDRRRGASEKTAAPLGFGIPVLIEDACKLMASGVSIEDAIQQLSNRYELRSEAIHALRDALKATAEPPATSMDYGGVGQVGCEGEDGLLRIHTADESCDVCSSRNGKG